VPAAAAATGPSAAVAVAGHEGGTTPELTERQRRLYKPEIRSCGYPQPIVLKVPITQGSLDVTPAVMSTSPPRNDTSAAQQQPYAVESARMSNATESLAEVTLRTPTMPPSTPPSPGVALHKTGCPASAAVEEVYEVDVDTSLLTAPITAVAGQTARVDDCNDNISGGDDDALGIPRLPSSVAVRRTTNDRTTTTASLSPSSTSSEERHRRRHRYHQHQHQQEETNSLLCSPLPSETERTVDIDPAMTEHGIPRRCSDADDDVTISSHHLSQRLLQQQQQQQQQQQRRVTSSPTSAACCNDADAAHLRTEAFESAHDRDDTSIGDMQVVLDNDDDNDVEKEEEEEEVDSSSLQASVNNATAEERNPTSTAAAAAAAPSAAVSSQLMAQTGPSWQPETSVLVAHDVEGTAEASPRPQQQDHHHPQQQQQAAILGVDVELAEVEALSDRDLIDAEDDDDDDTGESLRSRSTGDEGLNKGHSSGGDGGGAAADVRSTDNNSRSVNDGEEEAAAAAARHDATIDAFRNVITPAMADKGSLTSIPSSNAYSISPTSNRMALYQNLVDVLPLTSSSSLGAASPLLRQQHPRQPATHHHHYQSPALQSVYTIDHSSAEESPFGVARLPSTSDAAAGAAAVAPYFMRTMHHSTKEEEAAAGAGAAELPSAYSIRHSTDGDDWVRGVTPPHLPRDAPDAFTPRPHTTTTTTSCGAPQEHQPSTQEARPPPPPLLTPEERAVASRATSDIYAVLTGQQAAAVANLQAGHDDDDDDDTHLREAELDTSSEVAVQLQSPSPLQTAAAAVVVEEEVESEEARVSALADGAHQEAVQGDALTQPPIIVEVVVDNRDSSSDARSHATGACHQISRGRDELHPDASTTSSNAVLEVVVVKQNNNNTAEQQQQQQRPVTRQPSAFPYNEGQPNVMAVSIARHVAPPPPSAEATPAAVAAAVSDNDAHAPAAVHASSSSSVSLFSEPHVEDATHVIVAGPAVELHASDDVSVASSRDNQAPVAVTGVSTCREAGALVHAAPLQTSSASPSSSSSSASHNDAKGHHHTMTTSAARVTYPVEVPLVTTTTAADSAVAQWQQRTPVLYARDEQPPTPPPPRLQQTVSTSSCAAATTPPRADLHITADKDTTGHRSSSRSTGLSPHPARASRTVDVWMWPAPSLVPINTNTTTAAAAAAAAAAHSPLHNLLNAVGPYPIPPSPNAAADVDAAQRQQQQRKLVARDLLGDDVEELSENGDAWQPHDATGRDEEKQLHTPATASSSSSPLDLRGRGAGTVGSTAASASAAMYVRQQRAAASAADLAVVQELERSDRRRIMTEMVEELGMIFREEAAAFQVVSLMLPRHHHQHHQHHCSSRGGSADDRHPTAILVPAATSPSSFAGEELHPRPLRAVRGTTTTTPTNAPQQLLLPPTPPAPTSREEVRALLRTRGVAMMGGGDGADVGGDGSFFFSLSLVSAAVFTDELLHREVIEDDEVRARTMLRRLWQCEFDALWPSALYVQEALAWQTISETARVDRQRVRALDVSVNEEVADLLNISRELALCRMMEEEERHEVVERAEEAGRQRLQELHYSGLAVRLRQQELLQTSHHLALANALDDLTFDEAQSREELRVAAIRQWTAALASPSGTAVRQLQQQYHQQHQQPKHIPSHVHAHHRRREKEEEETATAVATSSTPVLGTAPLQQQEQPASVAAVDEAFAAAARDSDIEILSGSSSSGTADSDPDNIVFTVKTAASRQEVGRAESADVPSSSSSSSSSSSVSASVSISVDSAVDVDHHHYHQHQHRHHHAESENDGSEHHHRRRQDLDAAPQFFQWDPTSNSNSRPSPQRPSSSSQQQLQGQQQGQHSTSSPSPHLTNMTTLTTTTTTTTPSSSVLVGSQKVTVVRRSGLEPSAATTESRRSPTLVLPTQQQQQQQQAGLNAVNAAESSALLHALRCAEDAVRAGRPRRRPSPSSTGDHADAVDAAEPHHHQHHHRHRHEQNTKSGIGVDHKSAKAADVVRRAAEAAAAAAAAAVAASSQTPSDAAADAANTSAASASPCHSTPPPSPTSTPSPLRVAQRSPLFITRHTIPCSLRHSPSQSYHALLQKYPPPLPLSGRSRHQHHPHHDADADDADDVDDTRRQQEKQQQRPSVQALRARARVLTSPSSSSTSPRRYTDHDVYAYDAAQTRRHRSAARVRVPWDCAAKTDPRSDGEAGKGVVKEGSEEEEASSGKTSVVSTVMRTPAREVFPPRGPTLPHPRQHMHAKALVSAYVPPILHHQRHQQQPNAMTTIEVVTDTCVPPSVHDISVSPISSGSGGGCSPSRPRPPCAYAGATAAWTAQVEEKKRGRLRRLLTTERARGSDTSAAAAVVGEATGVDGASLVPGGRSTDAGSGLVVSERLSGIGCYGCSQRRPPELRGPLLITRLPFEMGPGVWSGTPGERQTTPTRRYVNGGSAGVVEGGEGITASPYVMPAAPAHVLAATSPCHTSLVPATLEAAFERAARNGDVVQLPTTVAELLRGPVHARLPLSPGETTTQKQPSYIERRGSGDGEAEEEEARADLTAADDRRKTWTMTGRGEDGRGISGSRRHDGGGGLRAGYNYVDVFYGQQQQQQQHLKSSPPEAVRQFITQRCAAVQEREVQHELRELLRPKASRPVARRVGGPSDKPVTITSSSSSSSFLVLQKHDSAVMVDDSNAAECCFDDDAALVLCSAVASRVSRERATAARRKLHYRHEPPSPPPPPVNLAARPSRSTASRTSEQQQHLQQQRVMSRSPLPTSGIPTTAVITASSSQRMSLGIPPGYRVQRAPSPSYWRPCTPSQPPSTPSATSASAAAAIPMQTRWYAAPAPSTPAAAAATTTGSATSNGGGPFTTHRLFFNTSGLSSHHGPDNLCGGA
jgi:hypothetical protein